MEAAPPKPRLCLRIGVSGHRPNRFPAAGQAKVREKLASLLQVFAETTADVRAANTDVFADDVPELRIVSALAEGADRLVAEVGRTAAAGRTAAVGRTAAFALDVILPFPRDVYETDFATAESKDQYRALLQAARTVFELPGRKDPANPDLADRAYETVGLMMLRQCDVLVAIWNGEKAAGRGGTAEIVQRAVDAGCPVLWFTPQGEGPFLLRNADGVPVDIGQLAAAPGSPCEMAALRTLVETLSAPPTGPARVFLAQYLREDYRAHAYWGPLHQGLLRFLGKKKRWFRALRLGAYVEDADRDWQPYWQALAASAAGISQPMRTVVLPRFAWGDRLANYYGHMHRSAYIAVYLQAALAVLFAAVPGSFCVWSIWELFAVALILGSIFLGKRYDWHRKWLDYRNLSATLRHFRALTPVGACPGGDRDDAHLGEQPQGQIWVRWYCRMTAREIGVPDLRVTAAYLAVAKRALREGEVDDQLRYHRGNMTTMENVAAHLEAISHGAFFLTLAICLMEVVVWLWQIRFGGAFFAMNEDLHLFLKFLTIFLPSFGAALYGIEVHGEFKITAERSQEMVRRLADVSERLHADRSWTFPELSAIAEYAVDIMESELADWNFVYRGRPLSLPA